VRSARRSGPRSRRRRACPRRACRALRRADRGEGLECGPRVAAAGPARARRAVVPGAVAVCEVAARAAVVAAAAAATGARARRPPAATQSEGEVATAAGARHARAGWRGARQERVRARRRPRRARTRRAPSARGP
jgi:hypothetical protein